MSTTQQQDYTYTRPALAATRSLLSDSPVASGTATPSDPTSPHGTLHRRKTNNYETALASQLGSDDGTTVVQSGLAYRGTTAAAAQPTTGPAPTGPVTDASQQPTPGLLGRQQSFSPNDRKREQLERVLSSGGTAGYSSKAAVAT